MTRDEIINLAISAGFHFFDAGHASMLHTTKANYPEEYFERFAGLVAAAEREACAQLVEKNADVCGPNTMLCDVLRGNAAAIRAR